MYKNVVCIKVLNELKASLLDSLQDVFLYFMTRNKLLRNFSLTKVKNPYEREITQPAHGPIRCSRSPLGLDHSGQMIVVGHLSKDESRHSIFTKFAPFPRRYRTSIFQLAPGRLSRQSVHQILQGLFAQSLRYERTAEKGQQ